MIEHQHDHHDHHDGNGYRDRLRSDDTLVLSRITSVAHRHDAMTKTRIDQPARSHHETLAILLCERGSKHDQRMVDLIPQRTEVCFASLGTVEVAVCH